MPVETRKFALRKEIEMSLKEDMNVLEYYKNKGLGKAYLEGTLTAEQREQAAYDRNSMPSDRGSRR